MLGLAIAAAPLGAAGLGTLTERFPGARPETIRIDAALRILAERGHLQAGVPVHMTIGKEQ
jgi:hypothetical protein